jgi:hypothetical protein
MKATLTGQTVAKYVTLWATFWTYQRTGDANPTIVTFHFEFEMKAA